MVECSIVFKQNIKILNEKKIYSKLGQDKVVDLLLKKGSNMTFADLDSDQALHIAAKHGISIKDSFLKIQKIEFTIQDLYHAFFLNRTFF